MGRPRKWIGELTQDLRGFGKSYKKGDRVICRRRKVIDEQGCYTNEWEYHYTEEATDYNLIRSSKFLIKGAVDE